MDRCAWARGKENIEYHDNEWGVPQHDDRKIFEFLILEGAQAGLSWVTILKRRSGYARAFSDFEPAMVARYDNNKVAELLADRGIIRNAGKINSAINNARRFMKVQDEYGSFDRYIWGFVRYKQVHNRRKRDSELPANSTVSEKMSVDMRMRGFTFVGPTICYSLMQAIGMVNDHTEGCFRY